ncbi:MAG: DUF1007 family protein [Alphaproteobacteria bacterium]
MTRKAPSRWMAAALAMALGLAMRPAAAHPHAYADIEVELVVSAEGRLEALRQTWVFDDAFSAFTIPRPRRGRPASGPDPAARDAARRLVGDLHAHGYFTLLRRDGLRLATGKARDVRGEMREGRLAIGFLLPLAEPADLRAAALSYAVFDPSYYIEMLHRDEAAIALPATAAGCATRLVAPAPEPEQVSRAAALGPGQSGGDSMGEAFAERIFVRCGAPP